MSTNIDLARAVEAQHFRADLFYRLSVASVRLPPLRERPADILPLARHFIGVYRSRLNRQEVQLSDAAQTALLSYHWSGNIRELENVIHFALIVCRDDLIRPEDIKLIPLTAQAKQAPDGKLVVGGLGGNTTPVPALRPNSGNDSLSEPDSHAGSAHLAQLTEVLNALLAQGEADLFNKVESALVHAAFAFAGQNQVRSAKVLGITRNMLRTQLKRHGLLDSPDEDASSEGAEAQAVSF